MAVEQDDEAGSRQPSLMRERNDLLRQARLRVPSPSDPTKPMSQRELAEAVTAHVFRTTNRMMALDRHDISRWERGTRRLPIADYRNALRAVLGAATDTELGFFVKRRVPNRRRQTDPVSLIAVVMEGGVGEQPIGAESSAVQVVVNPGGAVIVLAVGVPKELVGMPARR